MSCIGTGVGLAEGALSCVNARLTFGDPGAWAIVPCGMLVLVVLVFPVEMDEVVPSCI